MSEVQHCIPGSGFAPKEGPHTISASNECGNGKGGRGRGNDDVAVRKKRTWTVEEDEKLKRCVEEHGVGNWMTIERCSGLERTSKSCRLRWTNHLRPNLKKGSFTEAEEKIVVMLHQKYGNKWSFIASKLPGRTDNEIKNFWHSRMRRCRKQYLDIYPPNIGDEESPLGDINVSDRNHFPNDDYSSAATHIPQFSFVRAEKQENPTTYYVSQKPSSTCSSPNQTQVVSPNQVPFSSPHGLSSLYQPQSPELYTGERHPLPINTTQSRFPSVLHSQFLSERPPIDKLSSPEQGSTITASSSSVSSHKLQGSALASQISSPFNSITNRYPTHSAELHMSSKVSPSKLHTSFLSSPVSCNQKISQVNIPTKASPHSPSELKLTTPLLADSSFQVNPSMIPSLTFSSSCTSSTLELPVNSPPLRPLTLFNSSLHLENPCSLGFELPQSQSSPCHFNRASSGTSFAVRSELPSIQHPEYAIRPLQELKINLHTTDTESRKRVQGAPIQEVAAKTDLLYPSLTEDCLNKCLMNNISCKKTNKNEDTRDDGLNEGTFSFQSTKKEDFISEGWKTINSSGSRRALRKNLQGNFMVDKYSKTQNIRGKISRREGLLTEISKTGVLLVESAKKERLVAKLLNQGSNSEVLFSQSPKNENLQFVEVSTLKKLLGGSSSIEDSWTDISTEKDLWGDASDEDASFANSTLLKTNTLEETLLDESSWESVLLASYEQEKMLDLDMLGSETYKTSLLKPDGTSYELDSVQVALDQPLNKISRRNTPLSLQVQEHELKTIDPVFIGSTSTNQFKSGNWGGDTDYVGPCEDDCLKKSLMAEHADNVNEDFIDQVLVDGCWGENSNGEDLLAGKGKQMVLDESNWGISQNNFSNMSSFVHPNVESRCTRSPAGEHLEEGNQTSRNLKRRASDDKRPGKRFLRESSSERGNVSEELTLNDSIPLSTQSTTNHLSRSGGQCSGFAERCEGMKVKKEDNDHIDILPDELCNLLEFLPTILPEWNDFSCDSSSNLASGDVLGVQEPAL